MSEPTATAEKHPAHGHESHDDHGHHGSVYQHAKPYIFVGYLLVFFTGITVGLSYVHFEHFGPTKWFFGLFNIHGFAINIIIGMLVATFKVCLVGWYFMHLKQEGTSVWRPLFFTFFFCLGLFLLFLLAYSDPIPTTSHPLH